MKLVVQRVLSGKVSVESTVVGAIGQGLVVFVGISRDDTESDIEFAVRRILNMRLWRNGEDKPWDLSVMQMDFSVLLVSQFTLYGYMKGNRPDFHLGTFKISYESHSSP